MKTYAEYQDEITPEQLYKGLLVYGMFAEKLPPIFDANSFFDYCNSLKQPFSNKDHDFVYFESIRNTGVPRSFGIPVPMSYERLCNCLSDNWGLLCNHFREYTSNQHYKVSRIHLRHLKGTDRIFEMNYRKWWIDPEPIEDLLIGKKFIVNADISTFFPSIYTHSVPWAIIGKENAKSDRSTKQWYNKIDKMCRSTKSGETHGLLIGPHASNLVAEVILTVVDYKLIEKGFDFIRNIDDYECYVESYDRGQEFITTLTACLREFDLLLNRKKTGIKPLPKASVENWVAKVGDAIAINLQGEIERKNIKAFMDTVINLIDESGDDAAVLKYAMKTLAGKPLNKAAKDYYIKKALHLVAIYPYAMQFIEQYLFEPFNVSNDILCSFSNIMFNEAIKNHCYETAYYSIYFAIRYGFLLEDINVDYALQCDDCLIKLFTLLYYRKQADADAVKKLKADAVNLKKRVTGNMDRYWIFCYEALSEGQLNDEWKPMKKNKVSFLRSEYR